MDDLLMRILDRLDHPGRPWAAGERGGVLPLVEVDGVGPVAFPLLESQGQALRARATGAEVRTATERRGSPYTLVLTKTQRAFDAALAQWTRDRDVLETILDDPPQDRST
jgi:hypothetical protein